MSGVQRVSGRARVAVVAVLVGAWGAGLFLASGCGAPGKPHARGGDDASVVTRGAEPSPAAVPQAAPPPAPERKAAGPRPARVIFETASGDVPVEVELALTPEERARGLMHREELAVGKGMLFVFEEERVQSFWMKNTLIPLDMVFVKGTAEGRELEVVGVVREAEPQTLTPRSVGRASRYVVEVLGGWTAVKGIDAGTRLRFE